MRRLFFILLIVGLGACRSIELDDTEKGLPADLSISISLPHIETKAGYDDGNVSPADAAGSGWTDWDRLVDGQSIYRLTLFLVRLSDNQLVGFRDFYKNSPDYCNDASTYGLNGFCATNGNLLAANTEFATCARAYFSYLNPMYGSHEKLGSGSYRLYAVANYSPISGVANGDDGLGGTATKDYTGLPDDGNGTALTDMISGIKTDYEASSSGLASFNAAGYPAFFNYKVKTEVVGDVEQFVCAQRPQPLTFMTDFLVLSGTNHIEAELVRTYSRIRFVVHNDNVSLDPPADPAPSLTVKGLSFVTTFAQKQAFLFDFGTDDKYNSEWLGTPVLSSIHAIKPYDGTAISIAPQGSRVIFDSYILESKRGTDQYLYKIDVEYAGVSGNQIKVKQAAPIKKLSDLKSAYNAGNYKYLIKAVADARGFLYDNTLNTSASADKQRVMIENYNETVNGNRKYLDANVMSGGNRSTTLIVNSSNGSISRVDDGTLTNLELQGDNLRPFVWTLEKVGDWNFNIMNDYTGQYWNKLLSDNSAEKLKTVAVGYHYYAIEEKSGSTGLRFRNAYPTGLTIYLHRDGYGTNANSNDALFYLYPLVSDASASASKTINLQLLDPKSLQPYDLEEVRRNDFINVNIFVSIHPDGGFLEFKVIPWKKKDGSITFD